MNNMSNEQTYIYFIMFEGTYTIDPEEVNRLLIIDDHVTVHAWDDDTNTVLFDKMYFGTKDDFDRIFETATNMAKALDFLTHVEPLNVNRMDEDEKNSEIIWENNEN